ncbi:MAG: 5-(carboxyamino)imidazole ribonucleotide mutase [Planctomycetota bacterium]|nr:5-(carboxyamino)imidazole ribonucleotide mutase [Planctomycetota bacterium]
MTGKPIDVAVLMGSPSDWETMQHTSTMLDSMGVAHECRAISAHRQPGQLHAFITDAEARGTKIFIGAAGGAAHLPGVIASLTQRPVLGVPMLGWATEGLDALLSIAQMPAGVPVGALAIGKAGAKNAAILAAQILAISQPAVAAKVKAFRAAQAEAVTLLPSKS